MSSTPASLLQHTHPPRRRPPTGPLQVLLAEKRAIMARVLARFLDGSVAARGRGALAAWRLAAQRQVLARGHWGALAAGLLDALDRKHAAMPGAGGQPWVCPLRPPRTH